MKPADRAVYSDLVRPRTRRLRTRGSGASEAPELLGPNPRVVHRVWARVRFSGVSVQVGEWAYLVGGATVNLLTPQPRIYDEHTDTTDLTQDATIVASESQGRRIRDYFTDWQVMLEDEA